MVLKVDVLFHTARVKIKQLVKVQNYLAVHNEGRIGGWGGGRGGRGVWMGFSLVHPLHNGKKHIF